MLFKTDENLPVDVTAELQKQGHDAISVPDQQLAGQTDVQIAQVCKKEKRTIVTLDLDFSDIRVYPPALDDERPLPKPNPKAKDKDADVQETIMPEIRTRAVAKTLRNQAWPRSQDLQGSGHCAATQEMTEPKGTFR